MEINSQSMSTVPRPLCEQPSPLLFRDSVVMISVDFEPDGRLRYIAQIIAVVEK